MQSLFIMIDDPNLIQVYLNTCTEKPVEQATANLSFQQTCRNIRHLFLICPISNCPLNNLMNSFQHIL